MQLHFACLFGLSCDRDLLGHFLAHYKDIPFKSSMLFFHGDYDKDVFEQTRDAGFNATFVKGDFRDGTLRSMILHPFCDSLFPSSKVMTVDSDEFVALPEDFLDIVERNDVVLGTLYDCYADTLHPADPDIPLEQQYFYCGDFYSKIAGCKDCTAGVRRKVIVSRASLEINLIGSHYLKCEMRRRLKNEQPLLLDANTKTLIYLDQHPDVAYHEKRLPIMHYSFRDTIIERMSGKSYFTFAQICNVARFYGIPLDDFRIENARQKFEAIQQSMGWVPA